MRTRLLSFLGTGDYREVAYRWPALGDRQVSTRYVAAALAQLAGADEVTILATAGAEATHGDALRRTFQDRQLPAPSFVPLADGKDPEELWSNFRVVKDEVVRAGADRVIVDITHGFRSQPFFAGAVLGFVRALGESPVEMQVVYGAFDARDGDGKAPIWDLTSFAELTDWTHALRHFLRTGDARDAASEAERIGRSVRRDWAQAGRQGTGPSVTDFAHALRELSHALVTVRVGELLLERRKGDRPSEGPARVRALSEALERSRADLARHIPPVAEVLDRVADRLRPLTFAGDDLSGADAQAAVASLARLYFILGRYAEAAVVLREGWVNRFAEPGATRPGSPTCSEAAREAAERAWAERSRNDQRVIAHVRNDIEHAGFRTDPLPARTLIDQLDRLIGELENAPVRAREPVNAPEGVTCFVTRHAGARDWAEREGIQVDRVVEHLDVETVGPGDTVIGSLPVNLAARVCERGGRYLHLALEVPAEMRGKELTAEDMRRLGARVEEYRVIVAGTP
jgi:CRISPR-associated protein Csx16